MFSIYFFFDKKMYKFVFSFWMNKIFMIKFNEKSWKLSSIYLNLKYIFVEQTLSHKLDKNWELMRDVTLSVNERSFKNRLKWWQQFKKYRELYFHEMFPSFNILVCISLQSF